MKERVILREGILLEGREHSWWEEMEEEFAERRLLCSPSEPSQLARQVHTVRKTRMSRMLELILVTLLRVYQS